MRFNFYQLFQISFQLITDLNLFHFLSKISLG